MKSSEAVLLVIAKTALSDGNIDETERAFLTELTAALGADFDVDALLDKAKDCELESLVETIESYPDRFFVALRAYMMAHIDFEFDATEEAFFAQLIDSLKISDQDLRLIESTESAMNEVDESVPSDRIMELYQQSSFCVSS